MSNQNINIVFGVNEISVAVAGQSLATVKSNLKTTLGLSGDETVKVNGAAPVADYILKAGDEIEFTKVSGTKGAISVVSGVNDLTLDNVAGKKVSEVTAQLGGTLGIDKTYTAKVNGAAVRGTYVLKDGDELEYVKASGSIGDK
jgi:sulfur carrier protein ThiS